jgi:hypothetical protein
LFREKGYASFDDYCQGEWGWRKAYASQLISGSQVSEKFAIANEGQARALRRVPEPQRAGVMEQVAARAENEGRPVSAALIEEVASPRPKKKCSHCEVHCPSSW